VSSQYFFRQQVSKQLQPVCSNLLSSPNALTTINNYASNLTARPSDSLGGQSLNLSQQCPVTSSPVVSLATKVPPLNNSLMASLPAWASPIAKAVEGVDQHQVIFPYKEVS
jgi:hypothetical protein